MTTPTIYFYFPEDYRLEDQTLDLMIDRYLQRSIDMKELWEWHVASHPSLRSDGLFAWIIQPYVHLKSRGFPCELVTSLPSSGIVLLPRKYVPDDLKPGKDLLFVMIKGDGNAHQYSQIHLIENSAEAFARDSRLWKSHFMPHFPQPGLQPRDPQRGDRFENIAYSGLETNLAAELRSPEWKAQLQSLGFNWMIVDRDRWHDYRNIDAVVAVRSFQEQGFTWKPASKLLTAWHAGVPAILGRESAFQAERKSELDYIEVSSPTEIINALQRLREDLVYRQKMIENGKLRAPQTHVDQITAQWQSFLTDVAIPAHEQWSKASKVEQEFFMWQRDVAINTKPIRARVSRLEWRVKKVVKSLLPIRSTELNVGQPSRL
jgi:hypothetical protein